METPYNPLNLNEGERIIVHRGASGPICPNAESSYRISFQSRDGLKPCKIGLFYAIETTRGAIELRFWKATEVSLKSHGESNGILVRPEDEPIKNWWCHLWEMEGLNLALLGRPHSRKLGPQYEPTFPHVVSTTKWKQGLEQLPFQLGEYAKVERALRYPHLAQAYDRMKSPMDATAPLGSAWIFNS